MAKDLPYFKFFCSEWNDGDITLEDYSVQGLFINVCSYYWSNECYLEIGKLKKRFKNDLESIDYLFETGFLHNENGYLSIHFLDEQQEERKSLSKINSKNAKARWEKLNNEKNATASKPHCENDAIKKREEEIRKEKKRKDKISSLQEPKTKIFNEWLNYRKQSRKPIKVESTLEKLIDKFNSESLDKCIWTVNNSIQNSYTGLFWDNYKEVIKNNNFAKAKVNFN